MRYNSSNQPTVGIVHAANDEIVHYTFTYSLFHLLESGRFSLGRIVNIYCSNGNERKYIFCASISWRDLGRVPPSFLRWGCLSCRPRNDVPLRAPLATPKSMTVKGNKNPTRHAYSLSQIGPAGAARFLIVRLSHLFLLRRKNPARQVNLLFGNGGYIWRVSARSSKRNILHAP